MNNTGFRKKSSVLQDITPKMHRNKANAIIFPKESSGNNMRGSIYEAMKEDMLEFISSTEDTFFLPLSAVFLKCLMMLL